MYATSSIVTGLRPTLPMVTLITGAGGSPCRMMLESRDTRILTEGNPHDLLRRENRRYSRGISG